MLGNGRLEAQCFDGEKRLAHIRGKMRKKVRSQQPMALALFANSQTPQLLQVWINQGDIVLLSLREFQDDKADVIVKYTADEARSCMPSHRIAHTLHSHIFLVKAYGELPENAKINETDTFGDEEGECTFEFGDEDEVDIDDI